MAGILPTTTIERLCADALVDAERQIEARIAERVPPGLQRELEHLLDETVDAGVTRFVWLRQFDRAATPPPPTGCWTASSTCGTSISRREGLFDDVPAHRITRLRRHGERYFADGLREFPENRPPRVLGRRTEILRFAKRNPSRASSPQLNRGTGNGAAGGMEMKCMESKLSKMLFVSGLLASLGAVAPSAATRPGALPVPSPMAVAAVQAAAPGAVSATVEKLRETAGAIRGRIAALPRRPCTLSVEWRRYTTLMEYVLSRLTDESDARERQHALFVLGEINRFVTMAGAHSAETCVDYDVAAAAERTGQRHLQQARHRLLLVANAIRGDEFPFARFGEFQKFYKDVNWYDHASSTDLLRMRNLTTNLQQVYRLVQRNTSVNGGQVRVTLPRGQQKVQTRFTTGPSWPFNWTERNWLYWSVSEFISGGWQLQTVRFSRNCARKNSAYHCYGSTLRKLEAAQGGFRLSTMVGRQMQSALQAHVTAACKRTINNQEAMRDLVLEHRPDDKQVRQAYAGVAYRFLAEIARVARSGEDRLCSVSKFMDGLLDVAGDAWNWELWPGPEHACGAREVSGSAEAGAGHYGQSDSGRVHPAVCSG